MNYFFVLKILFLDNSIFMNFMIRLYIEYDMEYVYKIVNRGIYFFFKMI